MRFCFIELLWLQQMLRPGRDGRFCRQLRDLRRCCLRLIGHSNSHQLAARGLLEDHTVIGQLKGSRFLCHRWRHHGLAPQEAGDSRGRNQQ